MPAQDCIGIHLFKDRAAVFDLAARDDLQSLCFRNRIFAAMSLEVTDDNIPAMVLHLAGFLKHLVGLADTRGIAEINPEFSGWMICHELVRAGWCSVVRIRSS